MKKEGNHELIVIGAGLFRTGTNSLKLALQILLRGKCYHMKEVLANPSHIPMWIKALENDGLSKEEWTQIFHNFNATVDFPSTIFFEELMNLYPNSKIILTVRDPKSWIASVKKTVYKAYIYTRSFPLAIFSKFTPLRSFSKFLGLAHERIISVEEIEDNSEKCIDEFNKWTDHVKSVVPPERLLIFESKEGWEPLCNFLDLPIPQEEYPHVNKRDELETQLEAARRLAYFCVVGIPILIGMGMALWFTRLV